DVMNRSMSLDPGLLEQSPELAELLGDLSLEELSSGGGSILGDGGGFLGGLLPRSTPPALAAQLLFPYTTGARFVAGYRKTHPEDPSCSALYRRPPRTTAEVLSPELWESGFQPTLQRSGPPPRGFREVYGSALGQLLVGVLLTGESAPEVARVPAASWGESHRKGSVALGAGWRGDRVAVFQPTAPEASRGSTEGWIVVWVSDWQDVRAAVRVEEALDRRVPGARMLRSGSRIKTVFSAGGLSPAKIFRSLDNW
ncbi:MAG: hypothetical protein VX498_06555, partial [Myxococcota bacterium]|nr:hypothetical protein [Myxococcota bacterium]